MYSPYQNKKSRSFPWRRIAFDCIVFASLFLFPWWVVFILGIIGCIFFDTYIELIILGIFLDVSFGMMGKPWYWVLHTILFGITFALIRMLRVRMRPINTL